MVTPQLEKQVKVWHLIVGLAATVLAGGFTAGTFVADAKSEAAAVRVKVEAVESQRNKDVEAAVSDRRTLERKVDAISWVVVKMAQKQGIDTSRIEE